MPDNELNSNQIFRDRAGFKTSRFVVDLNEHLAQKQDLNQNLNLRKTPVKDSLYSFLNQEPAERFKKPTSPKPLGQRFASSINVLSKSGKYFYAFFHKIGWIGLFVVRFPYFLILGIFKIIVRPFTGLKTLIETEISNDAESNIDQPSDFSGQELVPVQSNESEPEVVPTRGARFRSSFIFLPIFLLVLILPFKAYTYYLSLDEVKGKVVINSKNALSKLFSAGKSAEKLNFQEASENFNQAGQNFAAAQNELSGINDLLFKLASLSPESNTRLAAQGPDILKAGEAGSRMGQNLTLAISALTNRGQNNTLSEALTNFVAYGKEAVNAAQDVNNAIARVDTTALPVEYQSKFIDMRDRADFLEASLADFVSLVEKLNLFLGAEDLRRYLVVFQNNTEARATGGFLGSYALIDFHQGKVKNLEVPGGGTYDTEAGLKERVVAPKPLWLVNPLWHLWDANWWPDWPTSAKKIAWFYEKSNGPTVDGVISLTPNVLAELLKASGPIDMTEEYGVVITSDNFLETLQAFAEQKPDVTKKPKRIIGDLLEKILAELPKKLDQQTLFALIKAGETSLNEKQILVYLTNPDLEKVISQYGWDGKVRTASRDYLMVINSNIAGGKSDRFVKQNIKHQAEINGQGEIIDTVTITREHTGVKNQGFGGVRNVNWLRVYAPAGSQLISANGFVPPADLYFSQPDPSWTKDEALAVEEENAQIDEGSGTKIYTEAGKRVFANWSMIDPGQTANITLKYRLPFKLEQSHVATEQNMISELFSAPEKNLHTYSLLIQKQSGDNNTTIETIAKTNNVSWLSDLPIWRYPNKAEVGDGGQLWDYTTELKTDKFYAVILEDK